MPGGSSYKGLDDRQRILVHAHLGPHKRAQHSHNRKAGDRPLEGWYVYREPTTIDPPTTLRLHYRDGNNKLLQVISITENGVTK